MPIIIILFIVLGLRRFDLAWPRYMVAPERVAVALGPLLQWAERKQRNENIVWLLAVLAPVLLWQWLYASVGVWLGAVLGAGLLLWLLGAESEFRYLDGLIQRALMRDKDQFTEQAERHFGMHGSVDDEGYVLQLMRRIVQQEASKVFALLFWLFVLGFWGALLYSLNQALAQRQTGKGVSGLLHMLMSWLPNRLLIVALALAGSFRGATEESEPYWCTLDDGNALLAATLPQVLDLPAEVEQLPTFMKAKQQLKALQVIVLRCLALWLIFGTLWNVVVG